MKTTSCSGLRRAHLLGAILAFSLACTLGNPASAAGHGGEGERVGYGNVTLQLMPMMAPYRTPSALRYEILTVRLKLAVGETERPACFMIPVIHEKMVMFLHGAKLVAADFEGLRREVLAKKLLDVAIEATDKSYFTGLDLAQDPNMPPLVPGSKTVVDNKTPPLDQRSQTLSAQCK